MILHINETELDTLRILVAESLEAYQTYPMSKVHKQAAEYQSLKALESRLIGVQRVRINREKPEAVIIRKRTI